MASYVGGGASHHLRYLNPFMEDLLAELTIDILSRLPVKTIFHCKCFCKKWRSLLLDSSFVDLHLSRSPTGLIIHQGPFIDPNVSNYPKISIYGYETRDPGFLGWVEIEDKDDYHHLHHDPLMSLALNLAPILQKSLIYLMGSVDGLICLWQNHPNLDNTYICNPVTREYMILHRQKYHRKDDKQIIYGFGVNSRTGEYKVIRTFQRHHKSVSAAKVYTVGTGQWRSVGRVPYEFSGSSGYHGSFLNDHCHWIVYDKEDAHEKLCTFDLDKETFQLFPSPPVEAIQGSEYHHHCLAILKGFLCKIDTYDSQFTVWVMKEYGIKESWHKEVVINQAINPDLDWLLLDPFYLIEGLRDGSILTLCEDKLWAFYPKIKTIEDTGLSEFSSSMNGLAYRPNFLKLQNFELESVHMF